MESRVRALFRARRLIAALFVCLGVCLGCGVSFGASGSPPAATLEDSVRTLLAAGRYAVADTTARALLARIGEEGWSDSLRIAEALDWITESAWRAAKGARPGVRELAERAVRAKETRLKRGDPTLARSRVNLGVVLIQAGDLESARTQLESALQAQRAAYGPEHLTVATTAGYLAACVERQGDLSGARVLRERVLAVQEKLLAPDDPVLAGSINGLANVVVEQGEYEAGRALYERSLGIYERAHGPEHPQVALTLGNFAQLQYRMGDFAGARGNFERALAIQEKTLGPEDRQLGFTLTFLGLVFNSMGDYEAAGRRLERALEIRRKALGPDHVNVATTLGALAEVCRNRDEYPRADTLLERALRIRVKALGPRHPNVGITLMDLSDVLARLGSEARAESAAVQADSILEAAYGPKHLAVAQAVRSEAALRLGRGDAAGSIALLERVRAVQAELSGPDYPELAETGVLLARAYAGHGDTLRALDAALRAEAVAREHLRLTQRSLSEREALRYAATRATGLDLALSMAEGGLPDSLNRRLLDAVIRSRALVLDETAARHRAPAVGLDSTARRLSSDLETAARRYASLLVRGPEQNRPDRFRTEADRARDAKERAERALAERSASFRVHRASEGAGVDAVSSALPPGSALLSYVAYASSPSGARSYAAFVLADSGRALAFVPLGAASRIERIVARWSDEAGRGVLRPGRSSRQAEAACREAGEALRRAVWDPVIPALRGAATLFAVPDGEINRVSFGALPARSGRYLVESDPLVHYCSAERDLAAGGTASGVAMNTGLLAASGAAGVGLLAVGGADFDARAPFASLNPRGGGRADERIASVSGVESASATYRGPRSRCRDFRSIRFAPLPETVGEIREVLGLWGRGASRADGSGAVVRPGPEAAPATALLGARATETAFKAMAPRAGMLHLATHGFFLGEGCTSASRPVRGIGALEPAVERSEKHKPRASASPPENPLLLSGLALAGANHREAAGESEEDGIVTAEEIAAMDLSGVGCAVLSACDTGTGKTVVGEGVFGLRRAFQVAGAKALVMSLWSVEDRAARQWMGAFYRSLVIQRVGSARAARDASRAMLRDRRARGTETHPFYWAGFVAVGDWKY